MKIDRGSIGRAQRFPNLDLESYHDFLTGFRQWMAADYGPAATKRAEALLTGFKPSDDYAPPSDAVIDTLERNALVGSFVRSWMTCQQMAHQSLHDEFRANSAAYRAELKSTDIAGPGRLELDPGLDIPAYARHEIHTQPGGYVGEEFAGQIYYHSTMSFYRGRNDQNELYTAMAASVPKPAGGAVKRILDIGCGIGQLTAAMKEVFPDAEVWGLDVAAPMLRFAHKQAVAWNMDVNYTQRLAEDTRFPDASFDIVTAYILFHEIPKDVAPGILQEVSRVLRPGGVFFIRDFGTNRKVAPFGRYMSWKDHTLNEEPFSQDFIRSDFAGTVESAGFRRLEASEGQGFLKDYIFVKP